MATIPTYQTTNVEEILANAGGAMPLIPDDVYTAVILSSELKDAKTQGNKFLELKMVVTQGQYKNTEFIERLNIINTGEKAATVVKIAYETLARIANAVGLKDLPKESAQLHNKPFLLKTKTEKGTPWTDNDGNQREGKDKSVIDAKGYAPVPSINAPSAISAHAPAQNTAPAVGSFPWQQ